MLLTIDSSVLVASFQSEERFHAESQRLLRQIRGGEHTVIEPLSVLVEVLAAIRRRTGRVDLTDRLHRRLRGIRTFHFVPLDDRRTALAIAVAREISLRGMDAIIVQIAQEFGSTLLTLDNEMAQRASSLVAVRAVTDF